MHAVIAQASRIRDGPTIGIAAGHILNLKEKKNSLQTFETF
jgi:hypothetical protein